MSVKLSRQLFDCVYKDDYTRIRLLLKKGVDVNIQNQSKQTPLNLACHDKKFDIADMLIEPHKQLSKDRHLFKRQNERYLFAEKGCGLYQLMDRFIQSKIEGVDER